MSIRCIDVAYVFPYWTGGEWLRTLLSAAGAVEERAGVAAGRRIVALVTTARGGHFSVPCQATPPIG
jgi:hypothetical protein